MAIDTMGNPVVMTGDGFGGGSFIWAFLIIALLGMGGAGWGGNNGRCATVTDVQNGFNTQDINGQLRGITYGLTDFGYAIDNKIEGAKDFITGAISSTKDAVTSEGRGLQMQVATAHCEDMRNVDALRFDMANYHADTNAVTVAQSQKILDALNQNKIEALQGRINQLELQNAMCGVVRYPNGLTYNAGPSPFCSCNNGCCC